MYIYYIHDIFIYDQYRELLYVIDVINTHTTFDTGLQEQ